MLESRGGGPLNKTRESHPSRAVVSVQRLQKGKKRAQFRLVAEVQLPASKSEVFQLLSDPRELNDLTPKWFRLSFRSEVPSELDVGTRLMYRLWLKGTPWTWQSRIDEWSPPSRFSYTQERGPYRWFWHDHRFEEVAEGTLVRDILEYSTWGGGTVNRWLIEPWLRDLFEWRAAALRRRFPA